MTNKRKATGSWGLQSTDAEQRKLIELLRTHLHEAPAEQRSAIEVQIRHEEAKPKRRGSQRRKTQ